MTEKITADKKETFIELMALGETMKGAARKIDMTYQTIRNEMKRSNVFEKRVREAQSKGLESLGQTALDNILWIGSTENKDVRSRLTANLSVANYAIPGFRGETKVTGKIEHDIKVISPVPRPKYDELSLPKVVIESPEVKELPPKKKKGKVVPTSAEDKAKLREANNHTRNK